MLKLQLPTEAMESAIRTYCLSGKQWERAAALFEGVLDRGVRPSKSTIVAVFEALAKGKQVGRGGGDLVRGGGTWKQVGRGGSRSVEGVLNSINPARPLGMETKQIPALDPLEADDDPLEADDDPREADDDRSWWTDTTGRC